MRTSETTQKETNKLQQKINLVLSVLFLITIFFFGVMTVAQDPIKFARSIGGKNKIKENLGDVKDPKPWDIMAASIKSADSYIAGNAYLATEMGYMNSSFQYALGKKLVATGDTQMLTLNTGHLYDVQQYKSMEKALNDLKQMRDICGDIPYVYVYEHPTLYSTEQMPDEYACLDFSKEMADDIITGLKEAGIRYIDSREVLQGSGLEITDYLMVTDQHWATRAAIVMTDRIAEEVTAVTGISLDRSRIAMENLDSETYKNLFLGKYGQRIGVGNVDPDDITIYWPTYETNIHRYTKYQERTFDLEGPFRDSCIRWQYLEPDAGKTWNIRAYNDYGLTEDYDIYENPDGSDITIMLLKDSYSSPIGSFLALMAKNVVAIDLRRSDDTLAEIIERYHPDIVVHAYSLQMLKQEKYAFQ